MVIKRGKKIHMPSFVIVNTGAPYAYSTHSPHTSLSAGVYWWQRMTWHDMGRSSTNTHTHTLLISGLASMSLTDHFMHQRPHSFSMHRMLGAKLLSFLSHWSGHVGKKAETERDRESHRSAIFLLLLVSSEDALDFRSLNRRTLQFWVNFPPFSRLPSFPLDHLTNCWDNISSQTWTDSIQFPGYLSSQF